MLNYIVLKILSHFTNIKKIALVNLSRLFSVYKQLNKTLKVNKIIGSLEYIIKRKDFLDKNSSKIVYYLDCAVCTYVDITKHVRTYVFIYIVDDFLWTRILLGFHNLIIPKSYLKTYAKSVYAPVSNEISRNIP